jgi:hypothetical protein
LFKILKQAKTKDVHQSCLHSSSDKENLEKTEKHQENEVNDEEFN